MKLDFVSRDSVGATIVVESFGEARPPGFVECSGTAQSESGLADSLGDEDEAGSSWFRVNGTLPSAECVGGARPLGIAKCSATTESVLAVSFSEESSDQTGPPWSRARGIWSIAEMAAVAKSVVGARPPQIANFSAETAVGEARSPGISKHSAAIESELAVSSGIRTSPYEPGG